MNYEFFSLGIRYLPTGALPCDAVGQTRTAQQPRHATPRHTCSVSTGVIRGAANHKQRARRGQVGPSRKHRCNQRVYSALAERFGGPYRVEYLRGFICFGIKCLKRKRVFSSLAHIYMRCRLNWDRRGALIHCERLALEQGVYPCHCGRQYYCSNLTSSRWPEPVVATRGLQRARCAKATT